MLLFNSNWIGLKSQKSFIRQPAFKLIVCVATGKPLQPPQKNDMEQNKSNPYVSIILQLDSLMIQINGKNNIFYKHRT